METAVARLTRRGRTPVVSL